MIQVQTHTQKFPLRAHMSFWSPKMSTQTGLHLHGLSLCLWWANVGFSFTIALPHLPHSWDLGVPIHPPSLQVVVQRKFLWHLWSHGAWGCLHLWGPETAQLCLPPRAALRTRTWKQSTTGCHALRCIPRAGIHLSVRLHLQGLAFDLARHKPQKLLPMWGKAREVGFCQQFVLKPPTQIPHAPEVSGSIQPSTICVNVDCLPLPLCQSPCSVRKRSLQSRVGATGSQTGENVWHPQLRASVRLCVVDCLQ